MTAEIAAIHDDCVACLARANEETGEVATLSILFMINRGHATDLPVRDLCFVHRRQLTAAIRHADVEGE